MVVVPGTLAEETVVETERDPVEPFFPVASAIRLWIIPSDDYVPARQTG